MYMYCWSQQINFICYHPVSKSVSVLNLHVVFHTGVVAFVAGGLVLLLPETRGVPLPETLDDIEFPNRWDPKWN